MKEDIKVTFLDEASPEYEEYLDYLESINEQSFPIESYKDALEHMNFRELINYGETKQ